MRGDRRLTLMSEILAIVSKRGGELVIAGPPMDSMIAEIADLIERRPELASDDAWATWLSPLAVADSPAPDREP